MEIEGNLKLAPAYFVTFELSGNSLTSVETVLDPFFFLFPQISKYNDLSNSCYILLSELNVHYLSVVVTFLVSRTHIPVK